MLVCVDPKTTKKIAFCRKPIQDNGSARLDRSDNLHSIGFKHSASVNDDQCLK